MKMIDFLKKSILIAIQKSFVNYSGSWYTSKPDKQIGENEFNVINEWYDDNDYELKIGYNFDVDDIGNEILVVRYLYRDEVKRFEFPVPETTYIVGDIISVGIKLDDFWNNRKLFKDDIIEMTFNLLNVLL